MIYFYVPVYNEQDTAGVLLYRLMEAMRSVDMEYEVHLTLDGCTDDSADVVEPYMKKLPLTVTHNETRRGYGRCLYDEISRIDKICQNPKRDYFMVLDADFSVDPAEIKEMAPGIERNAVLHLPDRLSLSKNRIGLAKRIANKIATWLLRKRGAKFTQHIDLLSTVRACRVHHFRRNMPRIEALNALPATAPPAVSGAFLFLALHDNSKKTEIVKIREQHMRRRKSRFSLFAVIRYLLFGEAVKKAIFESKRERDDKGGGRYSQSRSRRPGTRGTGSESKDQGEGDGERRSRGRSRGGRSRSRGRRSGGARASGQDSQQDSGQPAAKQKSDKPDSGRSEDKQGDQKSQADSKPGTGSSATRSRRRRRRPNKRPQDSSNKPRDKNPSE